MALFGKKKEEGVDASEAEKTGAVVFHPEKAAKWFDHARTAQDSTNYEYAMQCWLRGLALDPTSHTGLEGFFNAATLFRGSNPKAKLSKDTVRGVSGAAKGDLQRFVSALLAWGMKPAESGPVIKAATYASKLQLPEQTYWLGERALGLAMNDKKASKDSFIKLMESFSSVGAFDLASKAGDAAVRLDPGNGELAAQVRNMAAQSAMSQGGFDSANEEGGFRKNIRDADKQRMLEESERVVKTEDVKERLLKEAEKEYAAKQDDLPSATKYIKALRDRGTPEDEKQAMKVATRAYEQTGQFQFRKMAGEIRIRRARRKLSEYRRAAESNADDAQAKRAYREAQISFVRLELGELDAQMQAYPTDLTLKFEVGKRQFALGDHEQAIEMFQQAKNDARARGPSLNMLGQSFGAIGWNDEAIDTFRHALEDHGNMESDLGMELQYGLMVALQAKADADRSLPSAEEAEKLASGIAMRNIGYRDVRERRDAIKKLAAELREA